MRFSKSALFGASLVAAASVVEAHGSHGAWNTLNGRSFFESDEEVANLTARAAGCGPAFGGASCDASQCCSQDGQCGTGQYFCNAPSCLYQYGPACDANQVPPGTNTQSVSRPKFGNVPYGVEIKHCSVPGKVALTFDDGPYLYTNDLLDLLNKNNVKATFFIVGNNGGKGQIESSSTQWPTVMKRILNEGHQIASHTWSHQDLSTLNQQQITDQIVRNEIAFADVFGFIPTYLRPPYGRCYGDCMAVTQKLGYHVVNYDLDTLDWQENYDNSRSIFSGAVKSGNPSKDSFITLAHDIHYETVHTFVQYMIDTLKAAGYSTALVGECLNDPKQNWYRDAKSGQPWSGNIAQAATSTTPTTTHTTTTATTHATPKTTLTVNLPVSAQLITTTSAVPTLSSTLTTSAVGSSSSIFTSALWQGDYSRQVAGNAAPTNTTSAPAQRTSGAASNVGVHIGSIGLAAAVMALFGL